MISAIRVVSFSSMLTALLLSWIEPDPAISDDMLGWSFTALCVYLGAYFATTEKG